MPSRTGWAKLPAAGYLLLFALVSASGALLYFAPTAGRLFPRTVDLHVTMGAFLFALTLVYVHAHLARHFSRKLVWLGVAFTPFVIWVLISPTPSLVTFLGALLLGALLALRYARTSDSADAAPRLWAALLWLLIAVSLANGLYTVMGKSAIRFTSFHRSLHGPLALAGALLMAVHVLERGRWRRWLAPATPLPFHALRLGIAAAGILLALALGRMRANTDRIEADARGPRLFPTQTYAKAYGLAFEPLSSHTLGRSKDCAGCHDVVFEQWRQSTHAYSARNLPYVRSLENAVSIAGPEIARFCASCHDPTAAFSPDLASLHDRDAIARREGVSCRVCHQMESADKAGNGSYRLITGVLDPLDLPKEEKEHLILRRTRTHLGDFSRPLVRSSQLCAPCHRVALHVGEESEPRIHLEQFDSWKESEYRESLGCTDCHMIRLQKDAYRYSWKDHRFFGINEALPILALSAPDDEESLQAFAGETRRWLDGNLKMLRLHEAAFDESFKAYRLYFDLPRMLRARAVATGGQHLEMDVRLEARDASQADPRRLQVRTTNRTIGHTFPGGPLDLVRVWQEVVVRGASGDVLFSHSDPEDSHHNLGGRELYENGAPVERHEIFLTKTIARTRSIPPRGSVEDIYALPSIGDGDWPVTVEARWMYRRINDDFAAWMAGNADLVVPASVIASKTATLPRP
ncbi:MAG: hypothetical protein HYY13_05565 [Nitrospirae bacterium]|nr:hypothetical protein [Nitrospirota bacterium]